MSEKVIITRSKIDDLANVIGGKTDVGIPLTLNQMSSEVEKLIHKPLLLSLSNINTSAPVSGIYTPTSINTTNYITTDTTYYIIVEGTTTCTRNSTVDSFYYEGFFTTPSNTTDVVTIPLSMVQVISGNGSAHSQSISLGVNKVYIVHVSDQGASTCTSNLSIRYYSVKNITTNGMHDVKDYYTANVDIQGQVKELVVTPGLVQQVFNIYNEQDEENLKGSNNGIGSESMNNYWSSSNSLNFNNIPNGTAIILSGTFQAKYSNTATDTETITDAYFEFNEGQGTLITEKFIISIKPPNKIKFRYIGSQNCSAINWTINKLCKIQNYDCYNPVTVNPMENILENFIQKNSSITSFYNSNYTKIRPYAFACLNQLSYVELPNCSIIESSAFYSCTRLTSVSILNCIEVGDGAFAQCYSLTNINLPNCTIVGVDAFYNNIHLSLISLPNCLEIRDTAFYYCSNLTTLDLPKCQTISVSGFYACSSLVSVSLPGCKYLEKTAFARCNTLTSIYLPELTYLAQGVFSSCINLSTASFPKCSYLSSSCFQLCYNLLSLYLMSTSVVKLSQSNAFTSTPISNYTGSTNGVYGSIYVPSSLLTQYQSATNWTYYSSRLVGI